MNFYRHITDRETLEREYSPSSCAPQMPEILARYARDSDAARRSGRRVQTFAYGDHPDEALDFYPADGAGPAPVLIYFHGGYWQQLGKREHAFPAPSLTVLGVHYVAVGYGLAPASTLDEMVDRCRRAAAWVVRNAERLGVDPAGIHLGGCSAGAHLAAMTALADWPMFGLERQPVASLILLSGVFDIRPVRLTSVNDAVRLSADDALRNSPHLLVDAFQDDLPDTLAVVGAHEPSEFKRQSREFVEALARRGAPARFQEIPDRNHFDMIFDLADPATRFGGLVLDRIVAAERS